MHNTFKKIGTVCCISTLLLSVSAFGFDTKTLAAETRQNVEVYSDMPIKTVKFDQSYYKALLETESYNYKLIRNIPTAYEASSWDKYCSVANILTNIDESNIGELQGSLIDKAVRAREALVQVKSVKDSIWYLWNNSMPMAESSDSLKFTKDSYDNSDFKPFLVPYLLNDQKSVKGNMIVIAGGGYSSRGNTGEGYPIAEAFNKLGYNCYVLQRRVAPYSKEDIWMDMQRSIRYVRYKIEEEQLGGKDTMAAVGFSGGSGTILGTVANLYGDIQPTIYDKSYKPDKIDALSADLDVALPMYGPDYYMGQGNFEGLVTDNPKIPALFIAAGADDKLVGAANDVLMSSVKGKIMVEMHTFANVGHGFGVGISGTNSTYWINMADNFIGQFINKGKSASTKVNVEVPKEYTKSQTYTVKFPFGNPEVTYAANDDGSKFYIYFSAFEATQIIEGIVGKDGIATVTYDKSGFMKGDAQRIISLADQNAWKPIKR